jgi:hypothetical protein
MNRRKQYWALAFIAVVLLVLLFQTLRKAYRLDGNDLTSYLLSAQALLDGGNPYAINTPFPYIYPLFLAFVIVPLTMVPYWVANVAWFILNVIGLLISCIVLIEAAHDEIKADIGWHLAIPGLIVFLVAFSPIQNNLLNGQVNLIVLACCIMFFKSFTRNSAAVGAVWLAAAIALKLLPAVLLGFLLVRRKFRFALFTVAFAILFCLLPGLIVGENLLAYYASYLHSFLLRGLAAVGGGEATGFNLQSLLAYFFPWFGQSAWVRLVSLLLSALLVLAVDLVVIRSPHAQRHVWGFCAYLIGSLLLSPVGETHHLVFAIPAIVLVGMKAVFDGDWMTTGVKSMMVCFAVSFVVLPKMLDARPFHFVSLCMLIILLVLATKEPARMLVDSPRSHSNGLLKR